MALIREEHPCQLVTHSYSNLPILPPYSTYKQKLWRHFRKKLMLPSMNHPLSMLFFRSSAALASERTRYIRYNKWYIIHPLSNMYIIRKFLQFFIWTIAWNFCPYYRTFIHADIENEWLLLSYELIIGIYNCNTLLYFITGFYTVEPKELTFKQKQIFVSYIRTFFLVDILATFPFDKVAPLRKFSAFNAISINLQVLFKLARLPEYFDCFRHITYQLGVNEMLHDKLCLPLLTVLLIHWCSCTVYLCYLKTHQDNSWLSLNINNKLLYGHEVFGFDAYQIVMGKMICIFLRAGTGFPGDRGSKHALEQWILSMVMIIAFFLHMYIIIVVLQLSQSESASEYKYEEIVTQLKQFMRSRDLPFDLQYRILRYYEHRYQSHYFREDSIRAAISEHLHHEVFLNGCARLMETTTVMQGVSKFIIGEIIICLTPDVFLINDYVTRANEPADYLYFISYGTAAMYLPNGEEILHLEDGDLLGLMDSDYKYEMDVIAIEITEVFRWNRKDFVRCVNSHESLARRIDVIREQRKEYIKEYMYKKETDRYTGNVLYQLARGRIIDKITKRTNILESIL